MNTRACVYNSHSSVVLRFSNLANGELKRLSIYLYVTSFFNIPSSPIQILARSPAATGRALQYAINGVALGIDNPAPSLMSTNSLPGLSQSKH